MDLGPKTAKNRVFRGLPERTCALILTELAENELFRLKTSKNRVFQRRRREIFVVREINSSKAPSERHQRNMPLRRSLRFGWADVLQICRAYGAVLAAACPAHPGARIFKGTADEAPAPLTELGPTPFLAFGVFNPILECNQTIVQFSVAITAKKDAFF